MDSTTALLAAAVALAAAALAMTVTVLVRWVRTRRDLRRVAPPAGPRWIFRGAVPYFVLPTDLLPDPVYLDDIGAPLPALCRLRGSDT